MKTVELLTPFGTGAVAVIRLCGEQALARLELLLSRGLSPPPRIGYVHLELDGEWLDEALYVRLGDLEAELHVTASPPLVQGILAWLREGDTLESRAKSLEEMAQEDLPHVPCEAAARVLLDQVEGALRRDFHSLLSAPPSEIPQRVEGLVERGRCLDFALHPRRVVLLGPPNAGKSTLFNLLLGEDRALVDAAAGTTRDALTQLALLGEWPVELVDTAGLRELEDATLVQSIEKLGQERARRMALSADLCLWLTCRGQDPEAWMQVGGRALHVLRSLSDERSLAPATRDHISALAWPAAARARVCEVFQESFQLPQSPWVRGQGVPFRPEHLATLRELRQPAKASAALERLRSMLAPAG